MPLQLQTVAPPPTTPARVTPMGTAVSIFTIHVFTAKDYSKCVCTCVSTYMCVCVCVHVCVSTRVCTCVCVDELSHLVGNAEHLRARLLLVSQTTRTPGVCPGS